MKFYVITLSFAFIVTVTVGQTAPPQYDKLITKADSLYKLKSYLTSGHTYSTAFKSFGWKGYSTDRYKAARSWALASVPDSAISNLTKIVLKTAYSDYDQITNDKDLLSLHKDSRWQPLLKRIKDNKELIRSLDSLVTEDQKWRGYLVKYTNHQMGNDTMSYKFILRKLRQTDSLNYFELKSIIKRHGFPNYDVAGQNGSHNFWLLMQHQDTHPEFQEEVLVMMKTEADNGKASLSNYAYLLDRVKVNTKQLQVYGTQMTLNAEQTSYEPRQVIEPDKLNERRKQVGLGSIEDYIQLMNARYFGDLKKK